MSTLWRSCPDWCRGHYRARRNTRSEPRTERELALINARRHMAEEKLPPFTADTSLDLILLVQLARTLRDLGIYGWWLYGHCSSHGERQEPVFEENPPSQVAFGCRPCYRNGIQRYITVEDMRAI